MSSALPEDLSLVANTIRFLSAEGVEKAKSGHPGMPMGMAELGAVLWLRHLRHSPKNLDWMARDRFVLSNGHGSMFLYSLLHLSGYDLSLLDLQSFRQWESKTPGHPESFMTAGVETTTGPLGQGIANAVGMALGQKILQARYGRGSFDPLDHRVYCFCGDGCLMEGVSGEASSLAGHLGLDNLVLVYDDNEISIAGNTNLAFTEDVAQRYKAYGWHVIDIDGHDIDAIDAAYTEAKENKGQPTIIVAHTVIGKGSPSKQNTEGVHGAPLGADEMEATKKNLGWPLDKPFHVPPEAKALFTARAAELAKEFDAWKSQYDDWKSREPETEKKLQAQLNHEISPSLEEDLLANLPQGGGVASRKLSQQVLQSAAAAVPALIGGSADLEPSTLTLIEGSTDVQKGDYVGANIRFGVREHAMGAIQNGLAYYGGFIPYGATFLCFLDYVKPAVRLAALSELNCIYVFTHDSIFLGEDGPTHQPIEQIAMMRSIPNLHVYRPADGLETAMSYASALRRKSGPSALVLTRQGLPAIERHAAFVSEDVKRGAYTVLPSDGEPEIVIFASGSELALAMEVAQGLDRNVRVVSMMCTELFAEQDEQYREQVLAPKAKRVVIEAASTFGWQGIVGGSSEDTLLVGIDHFGASAPASVLKEKFGFTAEAILARIKEKWS
jgi:transketolase